MPIVGLTNVAPRFPRLGVLRKGGEKQEKTTKSGKTYKGYGVDLNEQFRFTSDVPDVMDAFKAAHGSDRVERLEVLLPYRTTDENFHAWVELWKAGGLVWRGDGERLVLRQSNGRYDRWELGDTLAPEQPQGVRDAKETARLNVIIPALKRFGYVEVQTHSKHDIMEIDGNLRAIEVLRANNEQGLTGIPLLLTRVPREISTPDGKGGRARRTKWLLHIQPSPEWVAGRIGAMQTHALASAAHVALPQGNVIEGDIVTEVVDATTGEIVEQGTWADVESAPRPEQQNGNGKASVSEAVAKKRKRMHALGRKLFGDKWDEIRRKTSASYGVENSKDLNEGQLDEVIERLLVHEAKCGTLTAFMAHAGLGSENTFTDVTGVLPDDYDATKFQDYMAKVEAAKEAAS